MILFAFRMAQIVLLEISVWTQMLTMFYVEDTT